MKNSPKNQRSQCPISCFLDVLGDKWSLLIIRDLMFNAKSTFGEFIKSGEGIATNILSSRLLSLEESGFIEKVKDCSNKKVPQYVLTDKGNELKPIFIEIYLWTDNYSPLPASIKNRLNEIKNGASNGI